MDSGVLEAYGEVQKEKVLREGLVVSDTRGVHLYED